MAPSALKKGTAAGNPTGIPLLCIMCDNEPTFTDVSHLLTHVSSKGHLAQRQKLELRRRRDPESQRLINVYDSWHNRYDIQTLLEERQLAKDQTEEAERAARAAREEGKATKAPKRARKPQTKAPVNDETNDMVKAEPRGRSQDNEAYSDDEAEDETPATKRRSGRVVKSTPSYEQNVPEEAETPDESVATEGELIEPSLQDKLKGPLYPGMGVFDSANEAQKRRRNQKKDPSVLEGMIRTSKTVTRDYHVWDITSGEMQHQRERDIFATPSVDGSPERDLNLAEKESDEKKKRGRKTKASTTATTKAPSTAAKAPSAAAKAPSTAAKAPSAAAKTPSAATKAVAAAKAAASARAVATAKAVAAARAADSAKTSSIKGKAKTPVAAKQQSTSSKKTGETDESELDDETNVQPAAGAARHTHGIRQTREIRQQVTGEFNGFRPVEGVRHRSALGSAPTNASSSSGPAPVRKQTKKATGSQAVKPKAATNGDDRLAFPRRQTTIPGNPFSFSSSNPGIINPLQIQRPVAPETFTPINQYRVPVPRMPTANMGTDNQRMPHANMGPMDWMQAMQGGQMQGPAIMPQNVARQIADLSRMDLSRMNALEFIANTGMFPNMNGTIGNGQPGNSNVPIANMGNTSMGNTNMANAMSNPNMTTASLGNANMANAMSNPNMATASNVSMGNTNMANAMSNPNMTTASLGNANMANAMSDQNMATTSNVSTLDNADGSAFDLSTLSPDLLAAAGITVDASGNFTSVAQNDFNLGQH